MKNNINDVNMSFSKSELAVVEKLASGMSEKEIADALNISVHTVNNHLRNVREKNGLHKNTEVLLLYIAYLKGKEFSLAVLKKIGVSAILVFMNLCDCTKTNL